MAAFDLGRLISIDEQTIGFKGHHADKLRISYKKEKETVFSVTQFAVMDTHTASSCATCLPQRLT